MRLPSESTWAGVRGSVPISISDGERVASPAPIHAPLAARVTADDALGAGQNRCYRPTRSRTSFGSHRPPMLAA
jgi:hypothetical protein